MSTHIIATQGLETAYWIATAMLAQVVAQVQRQVDQHPDEWSEQIKRELQLVQPEPKATNKVQIPPPPPII